MGKQQTAGQIKGEWHSRRKEVVSAWPKLRKQTGYASLLCLPISGFHTITLSKIHLSLLFIFIVSLSFAPEILALTATRRYDIATFDHTAGEQ